MPITNRETDPIFSASEAANLASPDKERLDVAYALTSKENFIFEGGAATWSSGLTFNVSAAIYYIQGIRYTSVADSITLDVADGSNGRFDAIVLDADGVVGRITGTPASNPAHPDVDPTIYVASTYVLVPAGSSTPSITQYDIYLENTEWVTSKDAGSTFTLASTNNPFAGTKDIEATAVKNGSYVYFTPASAQDLSNVAVLNFQIRSKATWSASNYVRFAFYNGTSRISDWVSFKTGNYSFNSTTTGSYQDISIPISVFALTSLNATQLRMEAIGGGAGIGFYLDNIILQTGVPVATASNSWSTFIADSGQVSTDAQNDILKIYGGTGIQTNITNDILTINTTSVGGVSLVGRQLAVSASDIYGWMTSLGSLTGNAAVPIYKSTTTSSGDSAALCFISSDTGVLQDRYAFAHFAIPSYATGFGTTGLFVRVYSDATNVLSGYVDLRVADQAGNVYTKTGMLSNTISGITEYQISGNVLPTFAHGVWTMRFDFFTWKDFAVGIERIDAIYR